MRTLKQILWFGLITWSVFAQAAEAFDGKEGANEGVNEGANEGGKAVGKEGGKAAASDTAAGQTRPSLLTQYVQRGEQLALAEEVKWFEVADGRRWIAVQPARGVVLGNVLVLADADTGANGLSYAANLREGLANYGWGTFFTNLSADDAQIESLVNAAIAQMPQGRPVIVVEGHGCVRLVSLEAVDTLLSLGAGLVCLNVPATGNQRAVTERLQAFAKLSLPTLVLQQQPDSWPPYVVLAQDVEVHVLPPGAPRSVAVGLEASQVLRKLRGWLRRRYAAT